MELSERTGKLECITSASSPSVPRESFGRREAPPIARCSSDPHDADGPYIGSVDDVRGPGGPEPIRQRPELRTMATHLRHAHEEVERVDQISVDPLGHGQPMTLFHLEEDVLEISLGRSRELESRSHSPL